MYFGDLTVRRAPFVCCEEVENEDCMVCMEPIVDDNTRILSICSPDPVQPRRCPRSPGCRGNAGVCGACEKCLGICVRCRSPLEPQGMYDLPWFACGMAVAIRVAMTILVVSRRNQEDQEL